MTPIIKNLAHNQTIIIFLNLNIRFRTYIDSLASISEDLGPICLLKKTGIYMI